jgi:hypothetical protein
MLAFKLRLKLADCASVSRHHLVFTTNWHPAVLHIRQPLKLQWIARRENT